MTAPKHAPRPDHLFLGNDTYEITWLSEEEWQAQHLDDGNSAETHSHLPAIFIRLRAGQAESRYQEILWHEITHACWDACALTHAIKDHEGDLEEFVISLQTPQQLFVLKQNPQVVKYLLADGQVTR